MSHNYGYKPYQKKETEANTATTEELIRDLSYQKHTAWNIMYRNIDKYIEMLTSLNTLEDEIGVLQSRLVKVQNELSKINEEIESLR